MKTKHWLRRKRIERNEENFLLLLETISKMNSLSGSEFIKKKSKYTIEDYNNIDNYSKIDVRFYEYIESLNEINSDKNKEIIYNNLLKVFSDILRYDKSPGIDDKINIELKECFSNIIHEMEDIIMIIYLPRNSCDFIHYNNNVHFVL